MRPDGLTPSNLTGSALDLLRSKTGCLTQSVGLEDIKSFESTREPNQSYKFAVFDGINDVISSRFLMIQRYL